jgi:hypothetical protein
MYSIDGKSSSVVTTLFLPPELKSKQEAAVASAIEAFG